MGALTLLLSMLVGVLVGYGLGRADRLDREARKRDARWHGLVDQLQPMLTKAMARFDKQLTEPQPGDPEAFGVFVECTCGAVDDTPLEDHKPWCDVTKALEKGGL